MTNNPFDNEFEKDTVVPGGAVSNTGQSNTVETVEDFKCQLANASPDDLAFLWARMRADGP
jgi:1-aminocyclopropane-1-carboxylate deaminase/D-cysteine desulfhydrase-like pyridoxal-dependent ACC family enzyme